MIIIILVIIIIITIIEIIMVRGTSRLGKSSRHGAWISNPNPLDVVRRPGSPMTKRK